MLRGFGFSPLFRACRFCWGIAALSVLLSCTPDPGRLLSFGTVHPIVVRDTGVEPHWSSMDQGNTLVGWFYSLYLPVHGELYQLTLPPVRSHSFLS